MGQGETWLEEASRRGVAPPRLVREVLAVTELVALALGLAGVVLPVLPTTPFLLVAAIAFLHSTDSLHRWLTGHPRLGPAIERLRGGSGFSLRTRFLSLAIAGLMIGGVAAFATQSGVVRAVLLAVLAAKAVVLAVLPTYRPVQEALRVVRHAAVRGVTRCAEGSSFRGRMGKQLCSWKAKRIKKRRQELVELIADPTHFCAKCGRAANRKRVLCKPNPIAE